jgi:WD40 repeat protein
MSAIETGPGLRRLTMRMSPSRIQKIGRLTLLLGILVLLTACSSEESPEIELEESTKASIIIAVPTFTLTPEILIPTPTVDLEGGYSVDLIADFEAEVTVMIDGVIHMDGVVERGTLLRSRVKEQLEIRTPHVNRLQILINGVEQKLVEEGGFESVYAWDQFGQLQGTPASASPTQAFQSTPSPPLYQLASGNASEAISAGNAVRLMDLVRIEIGSSYEFEPAFSPDGLQMVYRARLPMSGTSSEEAQSEAYINLLGLETGLVTPLAGPHLRSNLQHIQGATYHPIRNELLIYGDSTTSRLEFGEDGSVRVIPVDQYTGGVSLTGQAFSPDGKYFVRTSFTGAVFLYRDQGWRELFSTVVEPYSYLEGVYINWRPALDPAFIDEGRYFAVVGEGLQIWRTDDQSLHYQSEGAYYGDTSHLTVFGSEIAAAAPGNIYFLDVESKKISRILPAPSSVTALDYSVDGSMIAVGTGSGGLFFYDPYTNRTVTSRQAHTERITHLKFSPDGRWLATVSEDGTIALWAIP